MGDEKPCFRNSQDGGCSHSSNIAESLVACQREWGFPDPISVSDNAGAEIKAFKILKWPQVSCTGHNLNLAVSAALKANQASKIIAKGRKVVTYFHSSPTASSILREKQIALLPETSQHKLLQDCPTRWNSTLDMLARLLEQCPAVHAAIMDPSLKKMEMAKFLFSYEDQENVEAMIALLQPFKDATVNLSREDGPSLPAVYPTLKKLQGVMEIKDGDSELIKKMKMDAQQNLNKRYTDTQDILLISSFLHPRTKGLPFVDTETRQNIMSQMEAMLTRSVAMRAEATVATVNQEPSATRTSTEGHHDFNSNLTNFPKSEPPEVKVELSDVVHCKKIKLEEVDVMDWLDDVVVANEEPVVHSDPQSISKMELEKYKAEPSSKLDPLQWWKEREIIFPNLKRLAKKYLCVPASSVPCERIFSLAGHIVSKKRSSLSPENIDLLIFLHKNYGKI